MIALLGGAFLYAASLAQANSDPVGTPSVTGSARSEETLTADTSAIMDADGLGTFSYQWAYLDGTTETDISGATGSSYLLSADDVGKELIVKVSYTDGANNNEEVKSSPSDPVVKNDLVVLNKEQQTGSYSLTSTTFKYAQSFTSDATAGSHILDSIGITFAYIGNTGTAGDDITVTLNEAATSEPGRALCTLEDPSTFTNSGQQVFTAPAATIGSRCPDLEPEKTYYVVIEKNQSSSDSISLTFSGAAAIHSGSAAGWAISTIAQHYTTFFGTWADLATTGFMNLDVRSRAPFKLERLAETEVPSTWPLVPQGLTGSQKFRLMFLTTDEMATSDDINVYNEFVQSQAAEGHASIQDYASQFRVLGSTAETDGQDNTRIASRNEQTPPVSIFWLNGPVVANSYHELRGDRWNNEDAPRTAGGNTTTKRVVWTGSDERFRERTVSGSSAAFGTDSVGTGALDHATHGPVQGVAHDPTTSNRPLYALSGIFVIANTAASGQPTITGTPRVNRLLSVDTSAVIDPEGTDNALFTYQWTRFEDGQSPETIDGATGSMYQVAAEDEGFQIQVIITFKDDMGFPEGPLASDPTEAVAGPDVLVRNTSQPVGTATPVATKDAQGFTTGPNTDGYNLNSVGIRFDTISDTSTASNDLTVTLNAESSGFPGNVLCTLTDPASFTSSGIQTFDTPESGTTCPILAANTSYFVVLEKTGTQNILLSRTDSEDEDSVSADGWAISDTATYFQSGSWQHESTLAYMIEVKGWSSAPEVISEHTTLLDNRQGDVATAYQNTGSAVIAQGFRTGDTVGVYEVHEIHVDFHRGQPEASQVSVRIVESTAPDGDWRYATPTELPKGGEYAPVSVTSNGTHTFARTDGNSALKSNTSYFLVIESTSTEPATAATVRMTEYEGGDSDDGWSTHNFSHSKGKENDSPWTMQDHQVRFRISGAYRTGIGTPGDSYAYESCPELRRGERAYCILATAVPPPMDPDDPSSWPEDVFKSGLDLSAEPFKSSFPLFTGWWKRHYETLDFQVSMHPLPTGNDWVDVWYTTRADTAESGQDFWGAQGKLRFESTGPLWHTVSLRVIDDNVEDSGEYMYFSLYKCEDNNGDDCSDLYADDYVRGYIYNTEESKEISYLSVSDVTVTEGENVTAQFTVSLSSPATAGVFFDYTTVDGTAKDGADYTGGNGTGFIANGGTSVTLSVNITNDDAWKADRSFTLKISDAVHAAITDDTGQATITDDDPRTLTAEFANLPETNHGEEEFSFNIQFNQDVGTKWEAMQNDVLTVSEATVTGAKRVSGQKDLWLITVKPGSGRDVTITLPATTDCDDTGAVCTDEAIPKPLSNSLTVTVAGTALNAEFTTFERYHNGKTPITIKVTFSEEVDTTAAEIKDHALTVTGGAAETVVQTDNSSTRKWTAVIRPAGTGDVEVKLLPATDCALDGHICTADGELMAQGDWKTSVGPPVISVADATATEDDDAELAFAVTLDRKWNGPIPTVQYSTSDGTATAGSDYTAASGTLTLDWTQTGNLVSPWALTGIVPVPVANDEVTEEDETVTLTLSGPTWATLGDSVATGTIQDGEAAAEEPATPDSQPTGLPTITGTPQVDQPLTADTSAIDDANGLTNVSYAYQWAATAGGVESDVAGATGSTLTPRSDDVGKTYRVTVTFTDDDGYSHALTSLPSGAVAAAPNSIVWSADMTVVEYTEDSIGGATASQFSNIGGSGNLEIRHLWSHQPDKDLRLAFATAVPDSESMTLTVGDLELEFPEGSAGNATFKWTEVTVDWQDGEVIRVSIAPTKEDEDTAGTQDDPAANTAAAGKPTVNGTPEVGTILSADVSDVSDDDGLTNPNYRYQWLRSTGNGNADIPGATASSYTPVPADVGKTLRVRVTLTDDGNNTETLMSDPTAAVAAAPPSAPQGLTAVKAEETGKINASWQAPASNGGAVVTGYKVQWKKATGSWNTAGDVSEANVSSRAHAITGLEGDTEYNIRVAAVNSAGTGSWSTEASATPDAPAPENSEPTGEPTISGTPEVEKTLTVSVSAINDGDGLDDVSWEYQWLSAGAEISGATGSSLLLTDSHEGKAISVRVDFEDDAGNSESLTSAATVAVAARPVPLTAALSGLPTNHSGAGTEFQFTLTFGENVMAGFRKIRDHAFTESGADVTKAQRTHPQADDRNRVWTITVTVNADHTGAVTLTLPETTDCAAARGICTFDNRMLSHSTSVTVAGPQ